MCGIAGYGLLVFKNEDACPGIWRRWRSRWPGRLRRPATPLEPYRLVDPAGEPVGAVAEFFRDLQAAGPVGGDAAFLWDGSSPLVPLLWAAGVPWNRATRMEARDFCRWMLVAGKPSRPRWRRPGSA